MRRLTTAAAILALIAFAACKKTEDKKKDVKQPGTTTPATTTPNPTATPPTAAAGNAELVKKGAYLANVLACNVCHTPIGPKGPEMAKAWAGGLKVKEAFGEWVSPNITPHPETGIGKWSDEQIIAAIRTGVRADGTKLKPIMPYMFYGQMSDDDVKALVAYMRTLPAIDNKVERVELKMPHIPAPPAQDYTGKRGEYLTTLMHCTACHVPTDKQGMPDMKRAFAGGMEIHLPPELGTGIIYTPNITSDEETGIGKWTVPQIAKAIKSMVRPDGRPIGMPMAMYGGFWSQLTDEDVTAVAAFIKSIPPIVNKVPASTFKPAAMGPPGGKPAATKDDVPGKSDK